VKMVGAQHTQRAHPLVWDTIAESLSNYDNRFQWLDGNLLQVIQPTSTTSPISSQPSPPSSSNSGGQLNMGTQVVETSSSTPAQPSSAPPSPTPPSPTPTPPSPPSSGGGGYGY